MEKKITMEFKDILTEYCFKLTIIKRDIDRGDKSSFNTKEARYINLTWFQFVRNDYVDIEQYIQTITDKRTLNRKEFRLPESQRCPGCDDGKPYKVIKYRNVMIPVYDDDYGQQDFTVLFGKEISGGCYNHYSYLEFINYVDYELEKKYLNNEYNIIEELS